MKSQSKESEIDQLYSLSLFYERCRIPYLTKLLDLLSYCGIKFSYKAERKENQIVALAFFLQSIKGMTKSMTYKDMIDHIKASTHNYNEFKSNTRLFEIIYNFECETKETFKAIFVSNQLLMETKLEDLSLAEFSAKIMELFSTEDLEHGVVNLEFLINELKNIQNELKGCFFFFKKYLEGARSNVGLLTSKLIDNPITTKLIFCKVKCLETCDKLNPLKVLFSYYTYYAQLYQFNEKYTNAKAYITDGVSSTIAVPLNWTSQIIKPLDNMKVIVLDRVVKLRTDLSSVSESSRLKVTELNSQVIENLKERYGDMSAWISLKGNELNVVVKKKFVALNSQWLMDYVMRIQEINCLETFAKSKEMLCSYYKQWLNKGEDNKTDNGNSIQKTIEVELAFSTLQEKIAS